MSKYLITGSAGFIGFHLTKALLEKGHDVIGLDNLNDYYDVKLKYARLDQCGISNEAIDWNFFVQSNKFNSYRFIRMNIEDKPRIMDLVFTGAFDYIIHLAAQAGVRYSIDHPDVYIQSNIVGFFNILEACRHYPVKHLFYASSSSVYGNNDKLPFSEDDNVDHPISLYAATKKSNELMASTYSHLYGINSTGLRFFTVYGPWGRPDMAVWKFTEAILRGNPLQIYAEGKLLRDFTYIEDIVKGILSILTKINNIAPPMIMNIGNNHPITVNELISLLEETTKIKASIDYLPMQTGDVQQTYANIDRINHYYGFKPSTSLANGIEMFVQWYLGYN